ncbi:EboA domain-containing protein [Oryzobacter telluris]|uniref:EboA domain-containing protein n=1 Tax=Oryzobacter telluris TaxID=3149179 RepID=UPI00370D9454
MGWSDDARAAVAADGEAVVGLFPAAARHARAEGRDGEEVRGELLAAVRGGSDAVARIATTLYQRGDSAEKHAVLTALPVLDRTTSLRDAVGGAMVPVVRDALRTNDTRLVSAALGEYAAEHLDDPSWRQGVVKAIFMGIPLDGVHDLDDRADDELRRMVRDFAAERRAAGREVPADARRLLDEPVHHEPLHPSETTGSAR